MVQWHDTLTIRPNHWTNLHTHTQNFIFTWPLLDGLLVKSAWQYFKTDSSLFRKGYVHSFLFVRSCGGNNKYTWKFRTATSRLVMETKTITNIIKRTLWRNGENHNSKNHKVMHIVTPVHRKTSCLWGLQQIIFVTAPLNTTLMSLIFAGTKFHGN